MDIVVVGSINHDLTVVTPRHPAAGETVLGTAHYSGGGGKGANQAVAAARLGADVAMVGRVGADDHGRALTAALAVEGVDVSAIGIDEDAPTGIAVITIDASAENTIVVSPGANSRLQPGHLDHELITAAPVVLAQLEVPLETVTEAAQLCTGTFILNPAPARPLPNELLQRVDVLVPNRSELASLEEWRLDSPPSTVVTLGAGGAMLIADGESTRVPAPEVEPVDPTGAGDAFCGALAVALSHGSSLREAVERAVVAGAIATTRRGAQAAMPTTEEVEALLGR